MKKKSSAQPTDVQPEAGTSGRGDEQPAPSRVIYIGHLPHGFYEKQLLGYFSQFGKVSKVRVSRSKKTGKAKHYAFVEFKDQGIAEIAAAAMDGYFLLKQQVICKVLPLTKVHPKLFVGANRTFKVIPWKTVERSRHDKERTPEEQALRVARLLKRDKQRRKKIEEMGMEYDYPSLEDALPIKPKRVVFSD